MNGLAEPDYWAGFNHKSLFQSLHWRSPLNLLSARLAPSSVKPCKHLGVTLTAPTSLASPVTAWPPFIVLICRLSTCPHVLGPQIFPQLATLHSVTRFQFRAKKLSGAACHPSSCFGEVSGFSSLFFLCRSHRAVITMISFIYFPSLFFFTFNCKSNYGIRILEGSPLGLGSQLQGGIVNSWVSGQKFSPPPKDLHFQVSNGSKAMVAIWPRNTRIAPLFRGCIHILAGLTGGPVPVLWKLGQT